ncbi:MAG: DUF2225 domain-containing protein [candidate division Zixibacteria bacterium]|nr:DUF2225 domain-containing protein [candidate division Zixibacteria bacterium]MDH3936541.1 DUF2225 domain-containing protein [candidate division Zixibacteria bacterium]MDH4032296.1 DUF2225 domain-containing protein [candidate division Zixibacteria bacterium]
MANDNPFFLTKLECPICKTINEFETVRVGAYVEKGRDTDFCPSGIEWRYPKYQAYNPLSYFTATCTNCYYTREFNNSYKEWKSDGNFRTYRLKSVKELHLDRLATADSVLKRMGEAVDLVNNPSESAILKLHLAAFDELLCEHVGNLDLGRFYLRIGWVYRSMVTCENPDQQFLNKSLLQVDNRGGMMDEALGKLKEEAAVWARHLSAHFETDQVSTQLKSQMLPFRDKFDAELARLQVTFNQTQTQLELMKDLMSEYKSSATGSGSDGAAFEGFPSFTAFLQDIKNRWNGIVLDEQEALEVAVEYYKKAFEDGRSISAGNQQIQASYLIAELSRRIGRYEDAKQYFNTTIKYGQEFIYQNRRDQSRTALARKILELAIEQGRENMEALKSD